MYDIKNDRKLLYNLYVKEEMSLARIASICGVTAMTVRAWLKKCDIRTRKSTQTIYQELKEVDFNPKQKSLIIGSILGDGSITMGKDCKNARFTERHCEAQREYLFWKKDILKPFVKSKPNISDGGKHIISGVECNVQRSYSITTISHPYLTKLRHIFYPNGYKSIPINLSELIDDFSFAVWLCDDGSFVNDKNKGIYRIDLHTESFSYKENVFLVREILPKIFNGRLRINSRYYKSGKAYYICLSDKKELIVLSKRLHRSVPDCMYYKFGKFITT